MIPALIDERPSIRRRGTKIATIKRSPGRDRTRSDPWNSPYYPGIKRKKGVNFNIRTPFCGIRYIATVA